MPNLNPKATKNVPPYNRGDGTPVDGYTARNNPNFFTRQRIKHSNRPARVYDNERGERIIDIPQRDYNQVASGLKDPMVALRENGVQEWEIPTSGVIYIGNHKNSVKYPVRISDTQSE